MRTPTEHVPTFLAPDEPLAGGAAEAPQAPEFFEPPPGAVPDPAPGMRATTGDVVVLVGTTKGLFALTTGPDRDGFTRSGPWFPGEEIAAATLDTRGGRNRLLAGAMSWHFGPSVYTSDDLGGTWREPEPTTLRFPDDTGASVARVWQLVPAAEADPDVVWAGVEPAALFRSDDGGDSFALVQELWDHPHRPQWQPGGGGLCLHTIVPDPTGGARMGVAVSAAGFYRTLDGTTWEAANRGILPPFLPPPEPEFGQCVHKVAQHPTRPDTLFVQHHWGVYRSDDFGGTWTEIGEQKLPSTFGFPIVVDPNDPDTAYVIPLKSDFFRCAAEGKLRVFRTTDGGDTWEPSGTGLPDDDAYLSVLRDGFATDGLTPAGLYLGTRTGEVFGSVDGGETWDELTRHLPPVLCVKAAVLA